MKSALSAEVKAAIMEAAAEVGDAGKLAYTVRTFAKASDAGETSVRAAIKTGRLKAHRWGDKLIITAPNARAYLASLPEYEAA